MKSLQTLRPAVPRVSAWFIVTALSAALCAGCATTKQVESIVAESNAAMLAVQLQLPDIDPAGNPSATGKLPDLAAVSGKIDDFIAAHPNQKVAASALRVRQGLLLIAHAKYDLAQAAFDDATDLKTDRDKALKAVSPSFIWWRMHGPENFWSDDTEAQAKGHLEKLDAEIAKLQQSPGIRDALVEIRAYMGFRLATSLQNVEGKREVFLDALNRYGKNFTTEDIAGIKSGTLAPQSIAISVAEKRRLRALTVIERAKRPAQALGNTVTVADLEPAAQGLGELVLGPGL